MKERRDMNTKKQGIHIMSYEMIIAVWSALLILLGMTIAVAKLHVTYYSVLINLFIASVKAGLVLLFFMHLRYEGWFLKGIFLIALSALLLLIALTFVDVWYR
jgi:cytochrome c oxidase subunit 4